MSLATHADLLKQILENLQTPERLDNHPWTQSLIVQVAVAGDTSLAETGPGYQLAVAVGKLFSDFMPGTPPRQGKRLDTRWGEFGILAANYIAPFMFGTPRPDTLRDAWGRIDQAISKFLPENISGNETGRYKLVENELEVAPNSTISDWHRKGIERFAELIVVREKHLSRSLSKPSVLLDPKTPVAAHPGKTSAVTRPWLKNLRWLILILLTALSIFIGLKTWQIYQAAIRVKEDINALRAFAASHPDLDRLNQAGSLLEKFQIDVDELHTQAAPPLRLIGPRMAWVPVYGPDLAASVDLLDMAKKVADSALTVYHAAGPLLERIQEKSNLDPKSLTEILVQSHPQFLQARQQLDEALSTRSRIPIDELSPRTRSLMTSLDPMLDLMDDGISALTVLPALLGASNEGPQTYMILLQNEDELRATGGFISAVGSFVVEDGEVLGLQIEDSYVYENWSKPYPMAPWQMIQYMDIPVLLLRDANWFTDFPTTVSTVETLYAFNSNHSVDGVIAVDQQSLVMLLQVIGPLTITEIPEPITEENVIEYMRQAKVLPEGVSVYDWDRKAFLGDMAKAIQEKIFSGEGVNWETLVRTLLLALNQRHILLQFDEPVASKIIARHAWNGAVKAEDGDFLMVVDTNIGYSKTDAVMKKKLVYDVDLAGNSHPVGSLVVSYANPVPPDVPCGWKKDYYVSGDRWYPIDRCYIDYLRFYVHADTRLVDATPHEIPAELMIKQEAVPARVDLLDEEIEGVRGYGTLLVIPGGQSLTTSFTFALPNSVVVTDMATGEKSYTLKIQKQAGTRAIPITIKIHLPKDVQLVSVSPNAIIEENVLTFETALVTDVIIRIQFALP